jgi:hypothetical protein
MARQDEQLDEGHHMPSKRVDPHSPPDDSVIDEDRGRAKRYLTTVRIELTTDCEITRGVM